MKHVTKKELLNYLIEAKKNNRYFLVGTTSSCPIASYYKSKYGMPNFYVHKSGTFIYQEYGKWIRKESREWVKSFIEIVDDGLVKPINLSAKTIFDKTKDLLGYKE